ncbi:hypothetical protein ACFQ08_00905 [Streptosporangium algeriense]|uniref:Core-binding (CB) domain-containing protein n=1 Tax=Streptosporangium algeriense TaxID=1682748 RepID=A0ABW3DID7_9ACTN
MASIDKRKTSSGNTRYRVRWRLGGARTGEWQSETFEQKAAALTFKLAVEACEHHWPENWIKGFGWAPTTPPLTTTEPVLFAEYAQRFVANLSGMEERTRHDYERDLKNHIAPTFGGLDLRDKNPAFDRTTVSAWVNDLHRGIPDLGAPARGCDDRWRPRRSRTCTACCTRSCRVRSRPPIRVSNPAARTRLPRLDDGEGDDEMIFLTEQEFALLRACAKPDVRDMLTVFAGTGLRYAEPTALQVRDIAPFARPTLRVRRARKRQTDNTFKLGPPKTRQSRRHHRPVPHGHGRDPAEHRRQVPRGVRLHIPHRIMVTALLLLRPPMAARRGRRHQPRPDQAAPHP